MTYSIFDSSGNLVDAFAERADAVGRLVGMAQSGCVDVVLVAQDDAGNFMGDAVGGSAVSDRDRLR